MLILKFIGQFIIHHIVLQVALIIKSLKKKNGNCVSFFDSHLTTCKSSRYIWAFLYLQNLCFSRSMMLQRGLQLGIMPKFHLQYQANLCQLFDFYFNFN